MIKNEPAIPNSIQFTILCDYADIIRFQRIIVEADGKFHLYSVLPPFPTCEEYSKGEEFEEGELISIKDTWAEAYKAQTTP